MARPRSTPTLSCFFNEEYIPYARQTKRSWTIDFRLFKKYIDPLLGTTPLTKIKRKDVEDWRNTLPNQGLAPSSCNRVFFVLQAVMTRALRCGHIAGNPCSQISLFKYEQRQENFLGIDDLNRLMKYLDDNPTVPNRALQLMILTGAKKFEILNARWKDVDLGRFILKVPMAKRYKTRDIALSSHACSIISSLEQHEGCPWLFPGRDLKKPFSSLNQNWIRIRKELGLGNVCMMDLRHTFASILVEHGSTLSEVQQILGHYNSETTMRYFRKQPESLASVVETVGREIQMSLSPKSESINL